MKVCKACGIEKPYSEFHRDNSSKDGLRPRCKACIKVYDDQRREVRNQRAKDVYATDPQAKIAKSWLYHLEHPEWSRKCLRAHHVANRDKRYERYVERGKDPQIAAKRREATRRSESKRRAIKAGTAVEVISEEQFAARLLEFESRCYICDVVLTNNLHWDHYQPLTAGGAHIIANLKPSCDLCNVRKSNCWPFTEARRKQISEEVRELRRTSFPVTVV
jgi:HNH endonuclease